MKTKDMVGMRFGQLTVLGIVKTGHGAKCLTVCGVSNKETEGVIGGSLYLAYRAEKS